MVTFSQYIKNHRQTKQFRSSTPHFEGSPFKYATCMRVGTVKPKKPNSAQRKITKVCLTNGRYLIAYIPGFGHRLQKNNEVMIRGGRVPDLPGVRYHVMRLKKDFMWLENIDRYQRRSKYGVGNPNRRLDILNRREKNKANRREKLKTLHKIDKKLMKELFTKLSENFLKITN
uniref:Ribosomal protein S12 n=1 Tax=Physarum polycephalum TaxID=5791 RepID=F2Y9U6_PHYPO|nr:ribosomal protein S12 [Physarum polycephalum]